LIFCPFSKINKPENKGEKSKEIRHKNEGSKSNHSNVTKTETEDISAMEESGNINQSGNDHDILSLSRILSDVDISNEFGDIESAFTLKVPDMRQGVLASINEINEELDNLYLPISDQAQEHIHADECILVYGHSLMTELFLKAAARKRRFQVIVSEQSTGLSGLKLATNLSKLSNNISVTLISDSNIYAIMSRVNKVSQQIYFNDYKYWANFVILVYIILYSLFFI
jgi:translation initiation factor 2B subunit (eIF-2B alpha/beta/delta family)